MTTMQELTQRFNSGGWSFRYGMLRRGGLALGNVMHDHFNLARDIRVTRIRVTSVTGEEVSFRLGAEDLDVDESDGSYLRWMGFHAPAPFDVYTARGRDARGPAGIQARYVTRTRVFGDDTDDDDDVLAIEQSFIVTPYGKDPVHEPGGVLEAARLFPLVKFSYGGRRVASIRVDYRFQVSLDIFWGVSKSLLKTAEKLSAGKFVERVRAQRPMLMGMFRDSETPPLAPFTTFIFDGVEKPVLHEVTTYGLKRGMPGEGTPPFEEEEWSTWDNLHWWANVRIGSDYLKQHPSTPGAFHALHMHWRWPYFISYPTDLQSARILVGGQLALGIGTDPTKHFSSPMFKGIPLQGGTGGPLLDPGIPVQTIQFAITETKPPKGKDASLWDADACPSTPVFEDLFYEGGEKTAEKPRDISHGCELITWLSVTVHNEDEHGARKQPFEGTVLMHGCYFAHNPELPLGAFLATVDAEAQKPEHPTATWRRAPNDG
jgi:hypothetical protein